MKEKIFYVLKKGHRYYDNGKEYTKLMNSAFFDSRNVADFINKKYYDCKYKIKKITISEVDDNE